MQAGYKNHTVDQNLEGGGGAPLAPLSGSATGQISECLIMGGWE